MSFQAKFFRNTVTYIMEEQSMWGFLRKKARRDYRDKKYIYIYIIIFANTTENTEQWTIQIIFIIKLLNNLQISPSYPL